MEAKILPQGSHLKVGEEMVYPNPASDRIRDINWKMRHSKGSVTHADMTLAASVLSAYEELVMRKNVKDRTAVCSAIKRAVLG